MKYILLFLLALTVSCTQPCEELPQMKAVRVTVVKIYGPYYDIDSFDYLYENKLYHSWSVNGTTTYDLEVGKQLMVLLPRK